MLVFLLKHEKIVCNRKKIPLVLNIITLAKYHSMFEACFECFHIMSCIYFVDVVISGIGMSKIQK